MKPQPLILIDEARLHYQRDEVTQKTLITAATTLDNKAEKCFMFSSIYANLRRT